MVAYPLCALEKNKVEREGAEGLERGATWAK